MKRFLSLFLVLTLLFSAFAFGETADKDVTIYVSPAGNDDNDGINAPVATPRKALELAARYIFGGSVTIDFADGVYEMEETLKINYENTDGVNGHRLTFLGHGGAVLSGGRKVSGWEKEDGNIWKLSLPETDAVCGLYVDGKIMTIAQQEVTGSFRAADARGGIVKIYGDRYYNFSEYGAWNEKVTELYFTMRGFDATKTEELEKELPHMRFWFGETYMSSTWSMQSVLLTDDEVGQFTITFTPETLEVVNGQHMSDFNSGYNRYVLKGGKLLLDEEGEYYFDEESCVLYLVSAEDPNEHETVVPVLDRLVSIKGKRSAFAGDIRFENLTFAYNADIMSHDHLFYEQCQGTVRYLRTPEEEGYEKYTPELYYENGAIVAQMATDLTFENVTMHSVSTHGLIFYEQVYNTLIHSCRFNEFGDTAIISGHEDPHNGFGFNDKYDAPAVLTGVYSVEKKTGVMPCNMRIENNLITNCGKLRLAAPGILIFYCGDLFVMHNTIMYTTGCGIDLGTSLNNYSYTAAHVKYNGPMIARYNKIVSPCMNAQDAGGIYVAGQTGKNSLVSDNFIDMNGAIDNDIPGLYLDQGAEYMTMTNNLTVGSRHWRWFRCVDLIEQNGEYVPNSRFGQSTIVNCSVYGNFSEYADKVAKYGTKRWPLADEMPGANVYIEEAAVVKDYMNDPVTRAIIDAAGCDLEY